MFRRISAHSSATVLGRLSATLILVGLFWACNKAATEAQPTEPQPQPSVSGPEVAPPVAHEPSEPEAPVEAAPKPHEGPWLLVTRSTVGIYSEPLSSRKEKIAYARSGNKVPIASTEKFSNSACKAGWYQVVPTGHICSSAGTTDLKSKRAKFVKSQPDFDAVLPYRYLRNTKHGTPLYKSVPSREQRLTYEPYLKASKAKQEAEAKQAEIAKKAADEQARLSALRSRGHRPAAPALSSEATPLFETGVTLEEETPWWQQESIDKAKLAEVTLDAMASESDGILSKRMMTGFYVAVDRDFKWNGSTWFKTTKGLLAPRGRLGRVTASSFEGIELGGESGYELPMAWIRGRKSSAIYTIDEEAQTLKQTGTMKRFQPIALTEKTVLIKKKKYQQLKDGTWMRRRHLQVTLPGELPEDLEPTERWIDLNLKQQTLIAFIGDQPIFATLISSGRKSDIKEKDHRTPIGEWRVREKHITATMDGDGTAAGDLPYSIDDVPYVMYFHKAFALHGAFWHRNYGVRMSHGCVNLSPLDAKRLFFFADPPIEDGFYGRWAKSAPGSRIRVHE